MRQFQLNQIASCSFWDINLFWDYYSIINNTYHIEIGLVFRSGWRAKKRESRWTGDSGESSKHASKAARLNWQWWRRLAGTRYLYVRLWSDDEDDDGGWQQRQNGRVALRSVGVGVSEIVRERKREGFVMQPADSVTAEWARSRNAVTEACTNK